jgi:hypothetical protein
MNNEIAFCDLINYLDALHSEGSNCGNRLVSVDLHVQPPAHVAPSGFDKSTGLGMFASGSLVGTKCKVFFPSGATLTW